LGYFYHTPLVLALNTKNISLITSLIKHGANVNSPESENIIRISIPDDGINVKSKIYGIKITSSAGGNVVCTLESYQSQEPITLLGHNGAMHIQILTNLAGIDNNVINDIATLLMASGANVNSLVPNRINHISIPHEFTLVTADEQLVPVVCEGNNPLELGK